MKPNYKRPGFHTVTPYLIVTNAVSALDFYQRALGATVGLRMDGPGGKIMHAEIQIGDSRIMLADEFPQMGARSPHAIGGTPVGLALYVENVDETFARAIAAGAQEIAPVKNQFYGDRSGTFLDPFGHKWTVATHIEDVSDAEMKKRMEALFKGPSA